MPEEHPKPGNDLQDGERDAMVTRSIADHSETTVGDASHAAAMSSVTQRYVLGAEIARGGMGVVYRATDTVLDREVAVKLLRSGSKAAAGRRFAAEARITGRLQHPNIPAIHDFGLLSPNADAAQEDSPFLAMKLIEGDTLEELLNRRGSLEHDQSRFVAVFEQICHAVAFAHAHDVIHRDLKPANVMVGAFGEVQVMDWGLAKVIDESARNPRDAEPNDEVDPVTNPDATTDYPSGNSLTGAQTEVGQVMGTPRFMPPEQARGEIHRIDRRADVFSLGGILCVILTDKAPFSQTNLREVLRKSAQADVDAAYAQLDQCDADPDLVDLCRRCLSAEPEDRPADASVVAKLVAKYRAAVEKRLRQAETEQAEAAVRLTESRRRRHLQLWLAAAVVVLLLGGGGFAWYSDRQASAERERRLQNAEAVESLAERCEAALQDGKTAQATVILDAARQRATEGDFTGQSDRLERLSVDLTLLQELSAIDRLRWTPINNRFASQTLNVQRIQQSLARSGVVGDPLRVDATIARVNESAIRDRLIAALDEWLITAPSAELRAILQALDADVYRDAVRNAVLNNNDEELVTLVEQPEALLQAARFSVLLAEMDVIAPARGQQILTVARRRMPSELPVLMTLGWRLPTNQRGTASERVRLFQAAVAVSPNNPLTRHSLGIALLDRGEPGDDQDAIGEFREAIRVDPAFDLAHNSLGNALVQVQDWQGAIAVFDVAVRLHPKDPYPVNGWGNALRLKGDHEGAIAKYREAIRLAPDYATPHRNLADILYSQGETAAAQREYAAAIRLAPGDFHANLNLGVLLEKDGQLDAALESYRAALKADPGHWKPPRFIRRVQGFQAMLPRLDEIARGEATLESAAETIEFARMCGQPFARRYVLAVRLFDQAFREEPKLAADMVAQPRYSAACYAGLAVAGKDEMHRELSEAEIERFSALARKWLRAELTEHARLAKDPRQSTFVSRTLSHWKRDPDLAAFRKGAAWAQLWEEVDRVLAVVSPGNSP